MYPTHGRDRPTCTEGVGTGGTLTVPAGHGIPTPFGAGYSPRRSSSPVAIMLTRTMLLLLQGMLLLILLLLRLLLQGLLLIPLLLLGLLLMLLGLLLILLLRLLLPTLEPLVSPVPPFLSGTRTSTTGRLRTSGVQRMLVYHSLHAQRLGNHILVCPVVCIRVTDDLIDLGTGDGRERED